MTVGLLLLIELNPKDELSLLVVALRDISINLILSDIPPHMTETRIKYYKSVKEFRGMFV